MSKSERKHLCPSCNVVEMEFIERIQSDKYFRMRRFKCPVCDLEEMYLMEGPNDEEREWRQKQKKVDQKIKDELTKHKYHRE